MRELVALVFVALFLRGGAAPRGAAPSRAPSSRPKVTPPPAPPVAYVYRLPGELATRLQVRQGGKVISEGTFDELDEIDDLISGNHWLRAWEGVRDLETPPTA